MSKFCDKETFLPLLKVRLEADTTDAGVIVSACQSRCSQYVASSRSTTIRVVDLLVVAAHERFGYYHVDTLGFVSRSAVS